MTAFNKQTQQYKSTPIDEHNLPLNPNSLFSLWIGDAEYNKIKDFNAMSLSSTDSNGQVHSRVVLLKKHNTKGLVFFTNYESNKAEEFKYNNNVALLFFWAELERQIRIEGKISKITNIQSDKYFLLRDRNSQIASRISQQSKHLKSRQELLDKIKMEENKFANKEIPRPKNWGGYIVEPICWEFWQGQAARLNQRFLYTLNNNIWTRSQLQP